MTIVFRCKTKMPAALRRIFCLLHCPKSQSADHGFIRKTMDAFQNLLDFLWGDFFPCLLHRNTLISKKRQKTFHTLRIRCFMSTIYKRVVTLTVLPGYRFIGHQHKILYDLCRHICLIRLHIDCPARTIKRDLALREIKVNGTSVMSPAPEKF